MRRIFVLAGILVIVGMIIGPGCSRKKPEETAKVITLRWVTDSNPARKEQIALFEKTYPGIKINWDWASRGLQKVLTQMAGGAAPDLFDIGALDSFITLAKKGVMLDVTPYCKKYNVDMEDFWPQCKLWMYYEGKVYAFPTNAADFVLFYNKKLFDEAGIGYPDGTWAWEDLLDAAKKLTRIGPVTKRHTRFGILLQNAFDIPSLIWQNGGRKYTPDGKRCIINSPEAKEALRFIYDLRFKYHVMPSPSEAGQIGGQRAFGNVMDIFGSEQIAMCSYGRWGVIALRKIKDLDWDIAPLPKRKEKATFFVTRVAAISKTCKHPEEAFKFLLFLRSKEYNELISHSGDSLPACMSIAKSDIFLYDPAYPKEKNNQIYLDEMEYARNIEISPYVPEFEVGRIEGREYDLMWNKIQTPEETLDNIAKKVNGLIDENLLKGEK